MAQACWLVFLAGAFPLDRAWRANRRTSLFSMMNWTIVAWLTWSWALALASKPGKDLALARYLALGATGAALIAVLGARWPGARAWNSVVLGYVAVTLLPPAEDFLKGAPLQLDWWEAGVPAMALAIGVLNYLPTLLGPAAVMVGLAGAVEILLLTGSDTLIETLTKVAPLSRWLLVLAPWAAYAAIRWQAPAAPVDRLWLDFRNRFGLVWGQRLREQFNQSATHADWPVRLYWQGVRGRPGAPRPDPETQAAIEATLRALMKRFGIGQ
jgi:hypothetical protein